MIADRSRDPLPPRWRDVPSAGLEVLNEAFAATGFEIGDEGSAKETYELRVGLAR
jgi:hypothetical protein